MTADLQMIKKTFQTLLSYGVNKVNLRSFPTFNSKFFTRSYLLEQDLDDITKQLDSEGLLSGTINTTFNKIMANASNTIKDQDIENYRFVLIDIDPIKAEKNQSSSDSEKAFAQKVFQEIVNELNSAGFSNIITADSGNGYHILLPVEGTNVVEDKTSVKNFITTIANKFSTNEASIDTSVFNPSRLTKLYGTMACKGEDTKERPHRLSKLIHVPKEHKLYSMELIRDYSIKNKMIVKKYKNNVEKTGDTKVSSNGIKIENVNIRKWLDYYNLPFREKDGDTPGWKILVLEKCPLKEHTNSQSGASIMINPSGNPIFKCLHESHNTMNITDFAKVYPIVEDFKYLLSVQTIEDTAFFVEDFRVDKENISDKAKDGKCFPIASPMFIESIGQNIHDKTVFYNLKYKFLNNWQEVQMQGADLTTIGIRNLSKFGIDVYPNFEPQVLNYFQMQKRTVKNQRYHQFFGWHFNGKDLVYNLNKSYSGNNDLVETKLLTESTFDLSSKGEASLWTSKVEKLVLGNQMELAFVLGFVPIILGYLNRRDKVVLKSFLTVFYGTTTTGKTTSLRFIESIYGNTETLMKTMNSTQNALIKTLENNYGLPIAFDELKTSNQKDFSSLIYQLASGEERARLTKDIQLKKTASFSTMICLSSEESLSGYIENADGLKSRYIEFADKKWTKDAAHANDINALARNHYGHGAKLFIENLLMQDVGYIEAIFEKSKKEVVDFIPDSSLRDRLAEPYAMILTSGQMLKDLLGFNIRKDFLIHEIKSLASQVIEDLEKIDNAEIIREYIIKNAFHFLEDNAFYGRAGTSYWGTVKKSKDKILVRVLKHQFESILKSELQLHDIKPVIREFKESGFIVGEKDRNTKRSKMSDGENLNSKKSTVVYEVHLDFESNKRFFNLSVKPDSDVTQNSKIDLSPYATSKLVTEF